MSLKMMFSGQLHAFSGFFSLVVVFKYALLVLTLGSNDGQGGQIAIYCKPSRVLGIGPDGTKISGENDDSLRLLTLSETKDSALNPHFVHCSSSKFFGSTFKRIFSLASMYACFFGCSPVIADGLLTPTTSVLSAVKGIGVA